jgi:glycosyltransferase involved in cell wall biosynthesis
MRILHVLNHVRNSGNGIVNVTTDLACLQAQMGHSVGVVSQGGGNEELLARYGVTHFTIDQQRNRGLPASVPKLHHLFRQFQPEVVHAQMITGLVLAKILQPFVGYALVSTVHNAFQRSTALMGLADRVITVSNAVAVGMRRRGTPQRKIRVILNGTLGTPRRRPLSDYTALSLQRPAITTIAGLYERKGISDLIDAFAAVGKKYASAHLFIVGDGPDRALFEKRAAQLDNDENIHFVGFQSEPECYLLSSDIFVLASHTDSAPLVLPEARQAGCAIVATAVDGIPELLDEGAAGMLVEPRRPAALAAALEQLLGDDHLLATWRRRAQQNLERLGAQRVAEQTVDVYKELLDSRA